MYIDRCERQNRGWERSNQEFLYNRYFDCIQKALAAFNYDVVEQNLKALFSLDQKNVFSIGNFIIDLWKSSKSDELLGILQSIRDTYPQNRAIHVYYTVLLTQHKLHRNSSRNELEKIVEESSENDFAKVYLALLYTRRKNTRDQAVMLLEGIVRVTNNPFVQDVFEYVQLLAYGTKDDNYDRMEKFLYGEEEEILPKEHFRRLYAAENGLSKCEDLVLLKLQIFQKREMPWSSRAFFIQTFLPKSQSELNEQEKILNLIYKNEIQTVLKTIKEEEITPFIENSGCEVLQEKWSIVRDYKVLIQNEKIYSEEECFKMALFIQFFVQKQQKEGVLLFEKQTFHCVRSMLYVQEKQELFICHKAIEVQKSGANKKAKNVTKIFCSCEEEEKNTQYIKIIPKNANAQKSMENEYFFMKNHGILDDPDFMQIEVVGEYENKYWEETEIKRIFWIQERLIDGATFAQKNRSLKEHVELFLKIAQCLQKLHEKGICHWDVKPDNILWGPRKATLIDFGFSFCIGEKFYSRYGTRAFQDPEFSGLDNKGRQQKSEFYKKMDIYALGSTYAEIFSNKRIESIITVEDLLFKAHAELDRNLEPIQGGVMIVIQNMRTIMKRRYTLQKVIDALQNLLKKL